MTAEHYSYSELPHKPAGIIQAGTGSVGAGAGAGAFAAYLTTPFDVIKTRRQVYEFRGSSAPPKMMHIIGNILRDEGVSSLFAGVTPRVAKVAPACAIMIAAYDIGKLLLLRD